MASRLGSFVAVALALVAQPVMAQDLVFESFETSGFIARDGGFQTLVDTDALTTFEWLPDASYNASGSLRVSRTMATGNGPANSDNLQARLSPAVSGVITVSGWVWVDSLNGRWGQWLLQLHGLGNPDGTNAELQVADDAGRPELIVRSVGRDGYLPSQGALMQPRHWHHVEMLMVNVGAADGGVRGFLDGVEFGSVRNNWSGFPAGTLFTGASAYAREWQGSYLIDDIRVSSGIPVDRLVLTGPAMGQVSDCLPLLVRASGIDDAGALTGPTNITVRVVSADGGVAAVRDPLCAVAASGATLGPSAPTQQWGLRVLGPGSVEVIAESPPLIPGRYALTVAPVDAGMADSGVVDAGSPDAGNADAGVDGGQTPDAGAEVDSGRPDAGLLVTDAGPPAQRRLDVGCGCTSSPFATLPGWFALAWLARRRKV